MPASSVEPIIDVLAGSPNLGWGGGVGWLSARLKAADHVRWLYRLTLAELPNKTSHRWHLMVPGSSIRKGIKTVRLWYEAYASVSTLLKYPTEVGLSVGSRKLSREELALQAVEAPRRPVPWETVSAKIEIRSAQEMIVLVGSMALWTYLRKTKQVPGIAINTQANRMAIEWLGTYRRETGT